MIPGFRVVTTSPGCGYPDKPCRYCESADRLLAERAGDVWCDHRCSEIDHHRCAISAPEAQMTRQKDGSWWCAECVAEVKRLAHNARIRAQRARRREETATARRQAEERTRDQTNGYPGSDPLVAAIRRHQREVGGDRPAAL